MSILLDLPSRVLLIPSRIDRSIRVLLKWRSWCVKTWLDWLDIAIISCLTWKIRSVFHDDSVGWIWIENMFVSNASSFEYKSLALASQKKSIVFQASSPADIHVALGDDALLVGTSYEIVLGGEDNMQSWISTRKNGWNDFIVVLDQSFSCYSRRNEWNFIW